jgi:tetratricopeptide (TPR) repeat protein
MQLSSFAASETCSPERSIVRSPFRRIRWPLAMLQMFAAATLFSDSSESTNFTRIVLAQGGNAKNAKNANKPEEPTAMELPSLGFDYDAADDVTDPDETPDGKTRLNEVTNRAREIYREYNAVERERRPLAGPRDILAREVYQLAVGINDATAAAAQAEKQIFTLQQQIAASNDAALKNALSNQQQILANLKLLAQNNANAINMRQPKLNALNIAIKPLDDRLRKLWEELNSCRKQWLDLRVPHEKYARSDFEQLKIVIDDWLRIDGLWPDAFCWGALCAFELGDYEKAQELVERADKIRTEVLGSRKTWSQVEALQGLIASRAPGQRGKSTGFIDKAMGHVDREKDWVTHFVAGRAASEHERLATKAKAYFDRALKIKPNSLCVKYHLALLQTTSPNKSVVDVAAGTKLLESVWSRTGKRSWRMSFALVKAYDAAKRKADADNQWEATLALAPAGKHAELSSLRNP